MDFRVFNGSRDGGDGPTAASRKPTFIDLFAGCGGLSLGLLTAGWKGLFAVERDKDAFGTLSVNLISGKVGPQIDWPTWIPPRHFAISSFLKMLQTDSRLKDRLTGVDLVAGGPPCQGFSFAGKREHGDPRNALFRDYMKVVSILGPRMLLIENVGGISVGHGKNRMPFARKIVKALKKLGYETLADVHRASDFGVPQERPRYLIVGMKAGALDRFDGKALLARVGEAVNRARDEMLMEKGLTPAQPLGVRAALSDLETRGKKLEPCPDARGRQQVLYRQPKALSPYQAAMRVRAPEEMNSMRLAMHSKKVTRKFAALISKCRASGRRGVTLHPDELPKRLRTKKHSVVVLDPRKPSHTLTTLPDDLIHYDEPRILTVREYARLQSFPDWFLFTGKYTTGGERRRKECPRFTQIGNAVAPFVAEAFGRALLNLVRRYGQERLHARAA